MPTALHPQPWRQLLAQASGQLTHSASARLDAELLLAHVLCLTRGALITVLDDPATGPAVAAFQALLARRVRGEPIAYLTGQREFWSLPLRIDARVLVPRPESELLVELALALGGTAPRTVADLGTGSGAIAIALALERPGWRLIGTDASADALAVARANGTRLGAVSIQWRQGHWAEALADLTVDLLLSNPPYLASDDAALADPALQHEPQSALVAGPSGLECLEAIIAGAPAVLRPGGWLLLEHGATQAGAVCARAQAAGFTSIRAHPDLAGLPRVTVARRPPTPHLRAEAPEAL